MLMNELIVLAKEKYEKSMRIKRFQLYFYKGFTIIVKKTELTTDDFRLIR